VESPSVSEAPSGSPASRPDLPADFPTFPGARSALLPDDDPGLIAAWTTDQLGYAAYDFYVDGLPAAGYPIEGLYPGGEFAIIRFRGTGGAVWQVVVHGLIAEPVRIEVRLDRP